MGIYWIRALPDNFFFQTMQMIAGLIVLVLIALGVWWYMGDTASAPTDTTTPVATEQVGE